MPSRTFRVTRLLLFLLGCSALLLLAGPAHAEDGLGAISEAAGGVTDAAGGGGRAESGDAGDSNDRDGSAGRSDEGESSSSQDANTNLDESNLADRGGDNESNQAGSATDDASSHANDVSNQVDYATDASSHAEGGSDGASHQTESATDGASDPEDNVIASARDNSEDSSVQAADATNDGTTQVQEMAPDASRETPSRVVLGAPGQEQSDNANSDESSDAGRSGGPATEAFFGNSRDGETVTEPAATDAAESLTESAETATESPTEFVETVTAIGKGVTESLDAPRTRAAATLVQHTESLAVTEAIESAVQQGDSLREILGAVTETARIPTSLPESLELAQGHVGEAPTAATAATVQVRENAAQGTETLLESTRTHAAGAIWPVAGEALADHTGGWVDRDVNDGAAVTHSFPEVLTPTGERRALGEQAPLGSTPISVVRGAGSAEAVFAGPSVATEGRVHQGSEVSGAPFAPDALVVVSRPPNLLVPAGFSSVAISGLPESGSLEQFALAVWRGASTGGLRPLPNAPPVPPGAAAVPSTSGISASAGPSGGGSDAAVLIGDVAALLAPMLLGMLFMRAFVARTRSLTPPADPG
jgi:hypothetical protein